MLGFSLTTTVAIKVQLGLLTLIRRSWLKLTHTFFWSNNLELVFHFALLCNFVKREREIFLKRIITKNDDAIFRHRQQQFFFRRICKNSDNQLFRIPNLVITNKVLNYSDFDEAHNKMAQKGKIYLIIRFIDEENTIVVNRYI